MRNPSDYVYVNLDGSVRELTEDEQDYLSEEFHPLDGARPYIKQFYYQLTPDHKIHGFLRRDAVPPHIAIGLEWEVPTTREALVRWMEAHFYRMDDYSINGNFIWEGFGIDEVDSEFQWYYTERGRQQVKNVFQSEAAAVAYAFNQIKGDWWALSHCIGFLFDSTKADELKAKLEAIPLYYVADEIPYYGPEKPAYRFFVFGCDSKRAEGLKSEYFKLETK